MAEEPTGDELIKAFSRWAALERAGAAVDERIKRRWLGEQAAASATLTGILVDLAEQAGEVVIGAGEHKCSGRIVGVGTDFCVLGQANGHPGLIPLAAISAVWPQHSPRMAPSGDRRAALDLSLIGAFAVLADERAPVWIRTRAGIVDGDVWSVGDDVVTVRTGVGRQVAHVPLGAVILCELH